MDRCGVPERTALEGEPRALPTQLTSLPLPLAINILRRLPQDQLAQAAVVCRAWCRLIEELCFWRSVDLSATSGIARARATDESLRGALRRAPGQLESLKLGGWWQDTEDGLLRFFKKETVMAACAASAATLTTLHVDWAHEGGWLDLSGVKEVLRVAPNLDELRCCAVGDPASVLRMVQTLPPLQIFALRLPCGGADVEERLRVGSFCAALQALASHASLARSTLHFSAPPLTDPAAMAVFTSVMATLNPVDLFVEDCPFDAASALRFAALLRTCSLTELRLCGDDTAAGSLLRDGAAAAEVGAAIAANTQLTMLSLACTGLFDAPQAVPLILLPALSALPSLRLLDLSSNAMGQEQEQGPIGHALAALLARLPALDTLNLEYCALNDDGLGPLIRQLPRNATLRVLCLAANQMSAEFETEALLPAVQANTSLRRLVVASAFGPPSPPLEAAALFVASRDGTPRAGRIASGERL